MSALIGALRATLGLDSAAFEKGASAIEKQSKKLERSIQSYGKGMESLGQKLSLSITLPLAALAKSSVTAALESKDALAQVEQTITSMGNAAGRTAEQLSKLANNQMHKSLYDDDDILRKVTTTLLTFGKVSGATFDRAQQAAVDLAAKFNMDLQSAAMMLGKALNDPAKGITALTRAGVSFTAQQKDQIKAMVAAGDTAGAQAAILKELENQVNGAAAAAAKANPFVQLQHAWADFQENVGAQLLKVLPNIAAAIERVLTAFSNLSPGMQQAVVIGGALAAALGPVLMGLGALIQTFSGVAAIVGTVAGQAGVLAGAQVALAGLGGAIGAVIVPLGALAAAGALIYANWDKIAPVLSEFWQQAQAALGPPLRELITTVSATLSAFWNGPLGDGVRKTISQLGDLVVMFAKAFGPVLIVVLKATLETLTNVFGVIGDGIRLVSSLLQGDWSSAWTAAVSLLDRLFMGLPSKIGAIVAQIVPVIRTWVVDKLNAVWDMVKAKIDAVKGWFFGLYDAVVGHSYIPDMVDGIAGQMLRLDGVMVDPAKKAAKKTAETFKALAEQVGPLLDRLFPEAASLNQFRADRGLLDRAEKAKQLTPEQATEARRRLALEGHENTFDERLADWAGPQGPLDIEAIHAGLSKVSLLHQAFADRANAANVRVVESFKDMAEGVLSAVDRMAGAIRGGGFLDILSSVIGLGLQLGSIGVFGKSVAGSINAARVPAYASGTSFHPGGMALLGERGPELVDLPRGARVWPNGTGPGGGNTYVIRGNLLTPEFWAQIQAGDIAAANAGGHIGVARMQQRGQWTAR